jgi:hypothetical protein
MPHLVRQISRFLILCGFLFVAACSTGDKAVPTGKRMRKIMGQKVYYAPFDSVWRAAQVALRYPISINNMDNGVLETDFIKADDGFMPPTGSKAISSGVRYKINMILSKGRISGKQGVRVSIKKVIEKKRDFFAEPESQQSDGLEELVLFYRIERELAVDEALRKASGAVQVQQ